MGAGGGDGGAAEWAGDPGMLLFSSCSASFSLSSLYFFIFLFWLWVSKRRMGYGRVFMAGFCVAGLGSKDLGIFG